LLRWSGDAAEAHLRAVRELHDRRLLETLFRLHAKEVLLARAGIDELDRNRLRERAVRGIVALLLLAILLGLFGVLRRERVLLLRFRWLGRTAWLFLSAAWSLRQDLVGRARAPWSRNGARGRPERGKEPDRENEPEEPGGQEGNARSMHDAHGHLVEERRRLCGESAR